jgi:hypothetical protein
MPVPTPSQPFTNTNSEWLRVFQNVPVQWQSILDGMLFAPTYTSYWEQLAGGITENEAADSYNQALLTYLMTDTSFCDLMANCLEPIAITDYDDLTNGQKRILRALQGIGDTYNNSFYSVQSPVFSEKPITSDVSCDLDRLFAQCLQLTDYLNDAIEDLLEKLGLFVANTSRFITELIDIVPVMAQVQVIADVVQWLIDTAITAYPAFYDSATRTRIACDLFCLAQDNNCILDVDLAQQYFNRRAGFGFGSDTNYLQVVINMMTAVGDLVIDSLHAWLLSTIGNAGKFGLIPSADTLLTMMQAFSNDTNSDWTFLCDCTPKQYFMYYLSPSGNQQFSDFGFLTAGRDYYFWTLGDIATFSGYGQPLWVADGVWSSDDNWDTWRQGIGSNAQLFVGQTGALPVFPNDYNPYHIYIHHWIPTGAQTSPVGLKFYGTSLTDIVGEIRIVLSNRLASK